MFPRHALSRIEMLVGLLIVALLAGLIVSAIVQVREEADRQTCRNNLKQLGLAVHNYNDCMDHLPPLTDQGEGSPTGHGLPSVFANLRPFLEATPPFFRTDELPERYLAHSSVVFNYPVKQMPFTQEGGMANGVWKSFIDPADTTAENLRDIEMTLPDGTTGYYATGSYAANGTLPWGASSIAKSFPAGPANTILFGERPQVCRTASGEVVYNLWGLGFYSPHMPAFATLTPADPPGMTSTGQVAPVLPLPDETAADRDSTIRVKVGRQDAAAQVPDFGPPIQHLRSGRPCDPRLPASSHHAGIQVAMADGSVRVFGYDTSPWVFWAACVPSRGSGESPP